MPVNSFAYLLFLAALCIVYYCLCPRRFQWVVLLGGNLVFYLTTCMTSPVYFLGVGIVTWGMGILLEKCEGKKRKRLLAALGVGCCLSFLAVLKYGGFLAWIAEELFPIKADLPAILAPLGISYYTLIAISYLLDISRGQILAQRNLGKYMAFFTFFPQVTQGPLNRYQTTGRSMLEPCRFDYENIALGCGRILWGFYKKLVIADRMWPMVKAIFADYHKYCGFTCFLGCVYLTVQMYADFSGYMDIVVGSAKLFGVSMDENFRQPFFARSLAEYWRRWHMTLGSWFREYLFYPLAVSKPAVRFGKWGRKWFGVRVGKLFPALFALLFVWTGTGLWHDASMKYVLWGFVNGAVLMGTMMFGPYFQKWKKALKISGKGRIWNAFCMVRTFVLVSLLKIFPGADTLRDSAAILKKICTDFSLPNTWEEWFPLLAKDQLVFLGVALLLLWAVDILSEKYSVWERLREKHFAVRWLCYSVLLASILCFGEFGITMTGGFAYAQY